MLRHYNILEPKTKKQNNRTRNLRASDKQKYKEKENKEWRVNR